MIDSFTSIVESFYKLEVQPNATAKCPDSRRKLDNRHNRQIEVDHRQVDAYEEVAECKAGNGYGSRGWEWFQRVEGVEVGNGYKG